VTPAGIISTIAGASAGFSGDGGLATSALLNFPSSLVVDSKNNLFISDTSNYRIRRIDLTTGLITTVAGNGTQGLRGDGGSATEAQLDTPMNIALDAVGGLYIGDSNNHRIRKVTFGLTVPTLAKITEAIGAQGGAGNFMLEGTSFSIPLTINAGAGITVSDVVVLSETRATAKFTIATNAAAGPRDLNVTTDLGTSGNVTFTVVPPFADLSITSTKTGNWEVGFNGAYNIRVANDGVAPTAGPIVVTDTLPDGFSFVSGTGAGWSCSSANQDVTCSNSGPIDSGGSSTLVLIVAVGSNTGPQATHLLTASVNGDLVASNNTASDTRNVQTPFIFFNFSPTSLLPAGQATVGLSISPQFSQEVTGTLTLTFASSAAIPADDPAVQFVTGGRTVNFTIPANSSSARFSGLPQAGAIGFQTGTVAGNLTFTVSLQTGSVQTEFTNSRPVPRRPPTVHSVRKDNATTTSFNLGITVSSSEREITHLVLNFSTSPAITVSCGGVSGCTASGNALSLDVKSLFETWFKSTSQYGSLGTLTVPLTFTGTYSGTLIISLRNSLGTSNSLTVLLP
jgi:uncharacterized repeat protein (TIGR01451 family)